MLRLAVCLDLVVVRGALSVVCRGLWLTVDFLRILCRSSIGREESSSTASMGEPGC